jgi:hypothetical protein
MAHLAIILGAPIPEKIEYTPKQIKKGCISGANHKQEWCRDYPNLNINCPKLLETDLKDCHTQYHINMLQKLYSTSSS